MGSCGSSVASTGVTFLGLATSLCIAALFAPFWLQTKAFLGFLGKETSQGLFLVCFDAYEGNRDCNWIKFDNQEDWYKACMVLWAAGVAILLLCAIAAFFICCDSCKTPKFASFITFGTLFAAICLIATVIVFASKLGDHWDRDNNTYYDWGFYLAIVGSGFAGIAFLLFACSICFLRSGSV